jgi:hypothetical protein
MVAVGVARGLSEDLMRDARKDALAQLSQQIRVQVQASTTTQQQALINQGHSSETARFEHKVSTFSSVTLEGVEVLDTCREDGVVYVALGLDRARFAADTRAQVERDVGALTSEVTDARTSDSAGKFLEAAALYRDAAVRSEDLENAAAAVRVVGQAAFPSTWPPASELTRAAQAALAKASVVLKVAPEQGTAALRQQAATCLSYAGLPVTASSDHPDATILLEVALDPPIEAQPTLFVARAALSASLRRPAGETASAGADVAEKGGGLTADGATADALRRLGKHLPQLLDSLLEKAGWKLARCSERH